MLQHFSILVTICILIISLYIIIILLCLILFRLEIYLIHLFFIVVFCFILRVFRFWISIPRARTGLWALFKDFVFEVLDLFIILLFLFHFHYLRILGYLLPIMVQYQENLEIMFFLVVCSFLVHFSAPIICFSFYSLSWEQSWLINSLLLLILAIKVLILVYYH